MKRVAMFMVIVVIAAALFWVVREKKRQDAIESAQLRKDLVSSMMEQPFNFFKIKWGMSNGEVKKILENIKPQIRNKATINSKLNSKYFNQIELSGKTIQNENIIYHICGDKNNQTVFRFEFEDNQLVAIYIKSYPQYMEQSTVQNILESCGGKYLCERKNREIKEFDLTNCGEIYYIASPKTSSIPYAIWNASTNMTIERLLAAGSNFKNDISYNTSSGADFKTNEKMPNVINTESHHDIDKIRVEFYQKNVLELLN